MHYKHIPALQLGVTTDVVMFRMNKKNLQILLVKRDEEPFKGKWSLPGGFVSTNDTFEETIRKKVKEKTGYSNMYLEQLYSFDEINRDPRGRIISIAYIGFIGDTNTYNLSSQKNKETMWVNIIPEKIETENGESKYNFELNSDDTKENIELAFDHSFIISTTIERIVNKIWYSTIAYKLLPNEFTLLDAKNIFEIFLCKKVNNFHRRIKGVLEETGNVKTGQAYRPAKLFKVKGE